MLVLAMIVSKVDGREILGVTHSWLQEYNSRFTNQDWEPLCLAVHDDKGDLVGSLYGSFGLDKLKIDHLVVKESCRNAGIGKMLMEKAEELAMSRNCTGIYLLTYSFQALNFYLKLGYVEMGCIEGFENKASKHYLHKPLVTG